MIICILEFVFVVNIVMYSDGDGIESEMVYILVA